MRTILNIIWLIFSGLWMALGYALAGIICFILIVTIPFGIACFRIAGYALWPFGYRVTERHDAGLASGVGNVIWLVVAGIWLAIGHILAGISFCVTIIGIPFGIAHFKMVPVSLMPLGREIVPTAQTYPGYRWSQPGYNT
ncbi:YccF domain-containing protein [Streptomyces millisiae]|uniref:YccF domain-containing protein n=1 Tax=Streptomyces millisiae TaxID=3075542 RepID=A0ABU2LV26_9ACTN|nr:YccF domain-containing protein [Streptomyces sp. DSM 44918]MDT0320893.1 YccF domain-containing protein [Streptomyces sp. DSM 44918]